MKRPSIHGSAMAHEGIRAALSPTPQRTASESRAYGEQLRETIPLELHSQWEAPANRPDPVELLRSQEAKRVQSLLPIRHQRMSASPFAFLRGSALVMASDLSVLPATGIAVQACGDAHIANFGLFTSPEQRTVFDINDFDETLPGPWEWDVKRLVASIEVCGRDNGFSKKERKQAVRTSMQAYRETMQRFANMGHLDVWYAHLDVDTLAQEFANDVNADDAKVAEKVTKKAKNKTSRRAMHKLTEVVDGQLRIISNPPLIVPMRDLLQEDLTERIGKDLAAAFVHAADQRAIEMLMSNILTHYRKSITPEKQRLIGSYMPVDIARKVVGVGSVGTRALIIVMSGADENDPLVLQVKEAQESVLERFVGKASHEQNGERVVEGQRAMQTASDMLLGWCRIADMQGTLRDYYVRQLWNGKGSFDLSSANPRQLRLLAGACGWTLAHAHARTGDRFAIASYLGEDDTFDKALAKFARAYADQNQSDYERFVAACEAEEL